jgi:hypothetical protein
MVSPRFSSPDFCVIAGTGEKHMSFMKSPWPRREEDDVEKGQLLLIGAAFVLTLIAAIFGLAKWRSRRRAVTSPEKAEFPLAPLTPLRPDPHPTATGETFSHFEKPALPARPFIIGIVSFFVMLALIFVVVWNLAIIWTHGGHVFYAPPAPPAADSRWATESPQLQIDPNIDLQTLRQIEYQRLHTVRWTDGSHAYAAIPIENAMQLVSSAAAQNQLNTLLPAAKPATPIDLQDQKSREAAPQVPMP